MKKTLNRSRLLFLAACFAISCVEGHGSEGTDNATPTCDNGAVNPCGGCETLSGTPGQTCDGGRLECDGPDALRCAPLPAGSTVVIRGEVFDARTGEPLEGVSVSMNGGDGTVLATSHYDGVYLVPVSGPGRYQLRLGRDGWTQSLRIAIVPEGSDGVTAILPAYLTPRDSAVTKIGSSGGQHRNSTGTVEVVIPAGALTKTVDIRATQFQAGQELPGPLPSTTHFTYALELEPDIQFEKPVTLRLKNERGFAPGTEVPMGYFDFERGEWLATGTGVVNADGGWAEFQIEHFTPYDCNFPAMPPTDGYNPSPKNTTEKTGSSCDGTAGSQSVASEVGLSDGRLSEDVRLPAVSVMGLPHTLTFRYHSRAAYPVALFGAQRELLTPSKAIRATSLEVEFGGARYGAYYERDKRARTYALQLEARNAFGEWMPTGSHAYRWRFSDYFNVNFGTASWFGGQAEGDTGVAADEPLDFFDETTGRIAILNLRDSAYGAGWTIAEVSRLARDTAGSAPMLVEDGRGWNDVGPLVDLVAGNGVAGGTGDDATAVGATLDQPRGLAAGADGTVYIADSGNHRVRRVASDGTISTFAGSGTPGFAGDGGAATAADLGSVEHGLAGLALGPDGSLYIADPGNSRVRVVHPDGTIGTAAGNGQSCQAPSGTATTTCIGRPLGLAIDGAGRLYIASEGDSPLVYRMVGDQVERWAGLLAGEKAGRPYLARERRLACAREITAAPDGTLYLSPAGPALPGRIDPAGGYQEFTYRGPWGFAGPIAMGTDGRLVSGCYRRTPARPDEEGIARLDWAGQSVSVVVGTNQTLAPGNATIPANEFAFEPPPVPGLSGLAAAADGTVYFTDGHRVRRLGNGSSRWRYPDSSTVTQMDDGTYQRELGEGGIVLYDAAGRETERRDSSGNAWRREYDASGLLIAIVEPNDTRWNLSYANGRIASVVDPAGRTSRFTVDAAGNLVAATMPDESTTTFGYDARHLLVSKQPAGVSKATAYTYDKLGRIQTISLPTGEVRNYRTQSAAEVLTLDEAKKTSLAKPLAMPNTVPVQDGATTDGLGNTTRFEYDSTTKVQTWTDPLDRTKQTVFGYLGLPVRTVDANGTEVLLTYDTRGNIVTHEVPAIGAVNRTEWHQQFDLPVAVTDEVGAETRFEYDDRGRLLRVTDAEGGVWQFARDERGLVTSITNPTGAVNSFEYDESGNQKATIDPLGNRTEYRRDAAGNLVEVRDPLGNTTVYAYDNAGRVTSITDAAGATTKLAWGPYGECASCKPGDTGLLLSQTDPLGNTTTFEYNEIGQLLRATDPLGGQTNFEWDGARRLVSRTDAGKAKTRYTYDEAGQRVSTIMPDGGTISYKYDDAGFTQEVKDPLGRTTTYRRDAVGRVVGVIDPLGHQESVVWDPAGRVTSATRATGDSVALTWDLLGRLIERTAKGAGTATYTYDGASHLVAATDPNSALAFEYDKAGRIVRSSTGRDGDLAVTQPVTDIRYEYDAAGRRAAMVLPDGRRLDYRRDAVGRAVEALVGTDVLYKIVWDAAGRRTALERGALRTEYGYDTASRLTSIVTRVADTSIASFDYTLDAVGNPSEQRTNTGIHQYTYDKSWRLASAKHPAGDGIPDEAYAYDVAGNRKSAAGGTAYSYDKAGRLVTAGTTQYAFDVSGRMTGRSDASGAWAYRWDALDQLVAADWTPAGASAPTKQAAFRFDALGRRIESLVWPDVTRHVYDGRDRVADYDATGTLLASFTFGPGIDEPLRVDHPTADGWEARFPVVDRLGSVVALADDAGDIAKSYAYDSFGRRFGDAAVGAPAPFGYTGREWEPGLGLWYYRARWYNAETGSFISPDPIGQAGRSYYSYVDGQPTVFVDPDGLKKLLGCMQETVINNLEIASDILSATSTVCGLFGLAGCAAATKVGEMGVDGVRIYLRYDSARDSGDYSEFAGDLAGTIAGYGLGHLAGKGPSMSWSNQQFYEAGRRGAMSAATAVQKTAVTEAAKGTAKAVIRGTVEGALAPGP